MKTIAVIKNGATKLIIPADIIGGFPHHQGKYLVSKEACATDGIDPQTLTQKPPTPETEKYYLRMGMNPDGNELVDLGAEESERQTTRDKKLAEKWSGLPKTGNNKYPGACERCGELLPAGYGNLRHCVADTGCVVHMDRDGYHLTCMDRIGCDGRVEARRRAEREYAVCHFEIYLSGRGWGDYSPVVWKGNLRRSVEEIVKECRELLHRSDDLDNPLTDEQIRAKVSAAKQQI